MFSDDQFKATILFKLYKRGNWGASHTALDNLKKGWKAEDPGKHNVARVEKLTKQLTREGLIVPKPTGYGLQVSLNPCQNESIVAIMKKFFPEVRY
ncbi:MAG: hypothetical protein ABSF00_09285 [Candidatus Bathyarchaeia archaeon]|jgi:hypothetical protein